MNRLLPSLFAVLAMLGLAEGISADCVFLAGESALMLLLVLPALCAQIYELTPVYRRRLKRRKEEFEAALKCVDDLAELAGNKTEENVARFKGRWPDFVQRITSNDLVCRIAYEKGAWKLLNELSRGKA